MISCPTCQTAYTPERLGLVEFLARANVTMAVDVLCPVCRHYIHARVEQTLSDKRLLSSPWKKTKVSELTVTYSGPEVQ